MSQIKKHNSYVKKIQKQMEKFYNRSQKVKIYHGSTNSTRSQKFESGKFIDISGLNRIIEINSRKKYALVEPNVSIGKLVEETLEKKLMPPVVMEFPAITIGGGIQGGAGESSSHKFGALHNICTEYQIVLGNGDLITASRTKNKDLFYGTACSYGTLGLITLIKIKLIPAKNYVHLTYYKTKNFAGVISLVKKKVSENCNFVDGIVFSKHRGLVIAGNLSDKENLAISTFRNRSDEWFYLHADKISKHNKTYEEIVPVKDYLFRYDRGGFWVGRFGFKYLHIPFTKLTRYLFDRFLKTKTMYRFLHTTNVSQQYLVQDLCLPEENVLKFLQFVDDKVHVYPLWICPLRPDKCVRLSPNYIKSSLVIDVGVWGEVSRNYEDFIRINREIENMVMKLHGRKILYAHSYYPRSDFWKIYDKKWYNTTRKKYFANTVFPNIYKKVRVTEKYKPSITAGILRAIFSRSLPVSQV